MKSAIFINSILKDFEIKFGLKLIGAEQRSEAWFNAKLGVLSASHAHEIVAGVVTDKRMTYIAKLVAQIATGLHDELTSKQMDWGLQNEDAARAYYEFAHDTKITQMPFIFKDTSFREGCSPDGLVSSILGTEIKCPYDSANFVKFSVAGDIKPEWRWQTQFQMRVMDCGLWDMSMFDPRMKKNPMKTVRFERDEKMQKTLADAIPQFTLDLDKMINAMGFEWGDQWKRLSHPDTGANEIIAGGTQ